MKLQLERIAFGDDPWTLGFADQNGKFDLLGAESGFIHCNTDGWRIESDLVCGLRVTDYPGGHNTEISLGWEHESIVVRWIAAKSPTFQMSLPYRLLIDWLWGRVTVGQLLNPELHFEAKDILRLSELDGIVKCPKIQSERGIALAQFAHFLNQSDGKAILPPALRA